MLRIHFAHILVPILSAVELVNAHGIRVVSGGNACSGTVEIYNSGQWGTICDRGWGLKDAQVVCRELGCGLAVASSRGAVVGKGYGTIWLKTAQCLGEESLLAQCSQFVAWNPMSDRSCSLQHTAGVECTGKLEKPLLSLLSPYSAFLPGEEVRFRCTVPPSYNPVVDFHLFKSGALTPVVTQGAGFTQRKAELTLSDVDVAHQGSYTCLYTIRAGLALSSPQSNAIDITVVELQTPQIWYNTSEETPAGRVVKGNGFNVTCLSLTQYPGGSFQLRLIRSNGTIRHSVPAHSSSFTFTFPSAQASHEGYYCCSYRVQMGDRVFTSRESQPLPISVREAEPLISPVVISWLVSSIAFTVSVIIILTVMWLRCKKKEKLTELERDTRTCVENTYVALPVK